MHGVELVQAVIDKIKEEGFGRMSHGEEPRGLSESTLSTLRLPNGAELSPSLRLWLSFDATFLGLFEDLEAPAFPSETIAELALRTYVGNSSAESFKLLVPSKLPGHCLLLPKGTLARRVLYLGEPDSIGEPPVLIMDLDGPPFVGIEYPGIDVYLAVRARMLFPPKQVFGSFADDETYAPRMREHADRLLGGKLSIKLGDEGFENEAELSVEPEQTRMLGPREEVPEGYVVVEQMVNPFTGGLMRVIAPSGAVRPKSEA